MKRHGQRAYQMEEKKGVMYMEPTRSTQMIDAMLDLNKKLVVLCDRLRELDAAQKHFEQCMQVNQDTVARAADGVEVGQDVHASSGVNKPLLPDQPTESRPGHGLRTYFRLKPQSN